MRSSLGPGVLPLCRCTGENWLCGFGTALRGRSKFSSVLPTGKRLCLSHCLTRFSSRKDASASAREFKRCPEGELLAHTLLDELRQAFGGEVPTQAREQRRWRGSTRRCGCS